MDPIPVILKSFLVYKLTFAICSSSYIGETCRHFKTRIEEHINKDFIVLNIYTSPQHVWLAPLSLSFKIIDKANSEFDLKIKEALHINWRKSNWNALQNCLAVTLSL